MKELYIYVETALTYIRWLEIYVFGLCICCNLQITIVTVVMTMRVWSFGIWFLLVRMWT
jgi:hypothetical protein